MDYTLFGEKVSIPSGVMRYIKVREETTQIITHALESINLLFDGILSSPCELHKHECCTPEMDPGSKHYCLLGLLCLGNKQTCMSGRVFEDLESALLASGYPTPPTIGPLRDEFEPMANALREMEESVEDICDRIQRERAAQACCAADRCKSSDSLLGTAFHAVQTVRKGVRAGGDITEDNLSFAERLAFKTIDYDQFANRMRAALTEVYKQLQQAMDEFLPRVKLPDWGVPLENAAAAAEMYVSGGMYISSDELTKELVLSRIRLWPMDPKFAVQCVDRFGAEVHDLSRMMSDLGFDWDEECAPLIERVRAAINFKEEAVLLEQRKQVASLCQRFRGLASAGALLGDIDERLAEMDVEFRTVGEFICSTREEAVRARDEKSAVDSVTEGVKLFPLEAVDKLIAEIEGKHFQTEYGMKTLEKIRKHRDYMLTVDGVVYATYEEAEAAFKEKCTGGAKLIARSLTFHISKASDGVLVAKYWPGSLDPDRAMGQLLHGNLAGAIGSVGKGVLGMVKKSAESGVAKEAFSRFSGFFKK